MDSEIHIVQVISPSLIIIIKHKPTHSILTSYLNTNTSNHYNGFNA